MIFTFTLSIRAEVVTYRFGVVFWSMQMQQLHGFDEWLNDHGVIRKHTAKMNTTVVSIYLSASKFSFRLLQLAKII
jgi:hypothetical protein